MKNILYRGIFVLLGLTSGLLFNDLQAKTVKPPRPEKIEEVRPEKPSEYHIWISGHWNWKRKAEEWKWTPGYWKFDENTYFFRNRWRYNNLYRPWRYLAVPLGRGYYRIVRY
ncbi:MAG: YXWGXW repeat-containing protein [Saprospiraceae bacterium]|nr:YXWGXW repeat-containing protein [Saprospiraceae bacterium]